MDNVTGGQVETSGVAMVLGVEARGGRSDSRMGEKMPEAVLPRGPGGFWPHG